MFCVLEDEQDVHYCGRCKLSFFAISEYVQHKINKVCRENKNTLRKVVEKLPIGVNYKTSGTWEDPCNKDTDGFLPDDKKTTKINAVITPDVSSTSRRVEVQFLEPLVGSELTKDLNIADEATSSEYHMTLIEAHVGEQGDAPLAVGLLLPDVLEPIRLPHALKHSLKICLVRHHQRLVENRAILRGVVISLFSGFHVAQNKAKSRLILNAFLWARKMARSISAMSLAVSSC